MTEVKGFVDHIDHDMSKTTDLVIVCCHGIYSKSPHPSYIPEIYPS
jgi:hypothetical protein